MEEYYRDYLKLHQHPKCRLLHFIGVLATLIYIFASIYTGYYMGLIFSPFVVYPFAWSGHYLFEKNEPAAFKSPIKAKIADLMMFRDILLGRLKIW